jgi:uncharacterized protein YifE (UPF0438 family)
MGEHTTGWVYVIVNDSIPNKVKVGVTKNHPRLRAKEMNQVSAPLPTPYYLATAFLFGDRAYRVEQDTHHLLKKKGVHIEGGAGQEWFECSAIDAAYAIREASTLLNEPIQTEDPVLLTPEEIAKRERREEEQKVSHKLYLEKGGFNLRLGLGLGERLSDEEHDLLMQYGCWMEALIGGDISPLTSEQDRFIQSDRSKISPQTNLEKAWSHLKELRCEYKDMMERLGRDPSIAQLRELRFGVEKMNERIKGE